MTKPKKHSQLTEALARQLPASAVYGFLVGDGYFPESYVLPPCFHVRKRPRFGKRYTLLKTSGKFAPTPSQLCEVHFPKTDLTDRTFALIDPEIHCDIASEIAENWDDILDVIFDPAKRVYSYSFPIPVSSKTPGKIGPLRTGRMIYEWISMAEGDLVEEAYRYKHLVRADVKNFYPSVYTHSIAWALHTRAGLRGRWQDYSLAGNRLDKLFQYANDRCTNGLPIGPVVSDLISEIILSAVDKQISSELRRMRVLAVRFKDDYRFLCREEADCRAVSKLLQKGLKAFGLLLNEDKTDVVELPQGIFRGWISRYDAIRPKGKTTLAFDEFRNFYLSVLQIDRDFPGTGIIDRFISDMTDKKNGYQPRLSLKASEIDKVISLVLLLAENRARSFPKVLGFLEGIMRMHNVARVRNAIRKHLNNLLGELEKDAEDNRYSISWVLYFLRSNNLSVRTSTTFSDPILASIQSNRCKVFRGRTDFTLFRGVRMARRAGPLLKHLEVFMPQ